MPRSRLEFVVPWRASGPGWSNAGVTFHYEVRQDDGSFKMEWETVYHYDSAVVSDWLEVAIVALEKLKRADPRRNDAA